MASLFLMLSRLFARSVKEMTSSFFPLQQQQAIADPTLLVFDQDLLLVG
jgi:hypothetical protein